MSALDSNKTEATRIAVRAIEIAKAFQHEIATLEHVLIALLEDKAVVACLKALSVSHDDLTAMMDAFMSGEFIPSAPPGTNPMKSADFEKLFVRVIGTAMFSSRRTVNPLDILVQLLQMPPEDSHAVTALHRVGLQSLALKRYIMYGSAEAPAAAQQSAAHAGGEGAPEAEPMTRGDAIRYVSKYCTDLNEMAASGRIDPVIGRAEEVATITHIIARRTKNNAIMVGDPGVGKTAIAEGLAFNIVAGEVPEIIAKSTVYALDIGALVAGTRFRGDFEERMKLVLKSLGLIGDAILFIDEIHTIMDAGAGSKGSLDVANLLKPALAKGTLRCIGSTTAEEYRKHFEKDRALVRRFKKIVIDEPSPEVTKLILRGIKGAYEAFHDVTYTDAALDAAVDLTFRYVHDGKLPDKAIDAIDNAGARQRCATGDTKIKVVDVAEVEAEVARVAKIPAQQMATDEEAKLETLEDDLRGAVFGQDAAITALVDAVFIARAGLREMNKPSGSYLFVGPTGVGKTEVARQLAKTLGLPLLKFDMSEYMEKHSVSKLIGAPPGYVGFGEGGAGNGMLVNEIDTHPACVLLLDEIEKAHQDIYNVLLQVMDDGRLTNSAGKTVSFRNVTIIMTSNAGAAAAERGPLGFGNTRPTSVDESAIRQTFAPEFRNRLDAVVYFDRLHQENMTRIVDKFVGEMAILAAPRKVVIEVTDAAKVWLATAGYDPAFGARPLARCIAEHVKKPLSRMMLTGPLRDGGIAKIDVEEDRIVITA